MGDTDEGFFFMTTDMVCKKSVIIFFFLFFFFFSFFSVISTNLYGLYWLCKTPERKKRGSETLQNLKPLKWIIQFGAKNYHSLAKPIDLTKKIQQRYQSPLIEENYQTPKTMGLSNILFWSPLAWNISQLLGVLFRIMDSKRSKTYIILMKIMEKFWGSRDACQMIFRKWKKRFFFEKYLLTVILTGWPKASGINMPMQEGFVGLDNREIV